MALTRAPPRAALPAPSLRDARAALAFAMVACAPVAYAWVAPSPALGRGCALASAASTGSHAFHHRPRRTGTGRGAGTSRKDLFWAQVLSGLSTLGDDGTGLARIYGFVELARQTGEETVPGLTATPWWDPTEFAWSEGLESHWSTIRDELRGVLSQKDTSFVGDSALQSAVMGDGWSALRLQRLGEWQQDTVELFPVTTRLLRSLEIPFAIRGVMFARQAAKSRVARHTDGRNFVLTAHLGLEIPEAGCWIECGGHRKHWANGKAVVLDTSFDHETENASSEDRFVLVLDFWHPDLTPVERGALKMIYDLRNHYDKQAIAAAVRPQ